MNLRAAIFVCLVLSVFSCASAPVQTTGLLDWDSGKFTEKDGRLFTAVKSGDPGSVRSALSDNPNVNVADRLGQTAFMWACHDGNLEIINILLDHDTSSIAKKTKNYKKLNIKAQSKPNDPELKYNALFCFVMSSGINPYNDDARTTLKKIVVKNPSILDMTDYYGETVIHKLIRSNNDYFDVIITDTDKKSERDKQASLLNKPSKMHSPLRLAAEVGNRWMVEALANAAEKGMTIKDFSNDDIPVIAFDYGNGDLEIFQSYFKGKIWDDTNRKSSPRPNSKFEEVRDRVASARNVIWFNQIYNKYIDKTAEKNPNLLASDAYTAARNKIFDLAKGPMSEAKKKEFYAELDGFPDAVHLWDPGENKALVQYIIEEQSVDVLARVIQLVAPNKLPRAGNGCGDYLTIAMLGRKEEQMHFLLNRNPDFHNGITNLMNPNTRIEEQKAQENLGLPLMDPLQLFCASPLSDDRGLLAKMAKFYQPRFYDRSYRDRLINIQVSMEKYDMFEFFLDYDESFYRINAVLVNNKPVLEVLFSDREDLARKIVNNYIRKKWQLSKANEDALKSRDGKLWGDYQKALEQPSASSRSSVQQAPEQKKESEDSNLPENQAQ